MTVCLRMAINLFDCSMGNYLKFRVTFKYISQVSCCAWLLGFILTTHQAAAAQWGSLLTLSLCLSTVFLHDSVWRQSSAPIVSLLPRSAAATAPHWFFYYCSSQDDISHFVSSAFFLPLISVADYSASVDSDLMREPTKLLLPSFTVIALCSTPAGLAQAARRAANNINGGGDRHFYTSAEACDWQTTIQLMKS